MKRLAVALGMMIAVTGCRSSHNGGDDDVTPDSSVSDDVAIQDIQSEGMPADTPVTVRGVVVTAVDNYGGRTGAVYVEEPGGGEYSGVVVNSLPSQSAGILVGDLIDIEGGFKDEFACTGDICGGTVDTTGRTITQITGSTLVLTKVGDGTVPAPQLLDPRDLAADDTEAEKWEGVLIQFNDVGVNSPPSGVSSTDPLLMEMKVTGPFAVSSSLTELDFARDFCFTSIVGIGDYFFSYKILPRSADDLVGGGGACPAQEAGDTDCGDLSDNDADGFMDCADFSCQDSVAACTADTDILSIRDGTITVNSTVALSDVYVVGVAYNKKNLWVSDHPDAELDEGIYVFRGFGSVSDLPAEVVVGARVNVAATVSAYHGLLELSADPDTGVSFSQAGADPNPITGASLGTIADATTGEPYEGSLVTITDVSVSALGANHQFTVTDGTDSIVVDDEIYRHTAADPQCFTSITGIVHADTNLADDPAPRILLPRSADDVVTTACP
jgi:hypothetical protein